MIPSQSIRKARRIVGRCRRENWYGPGFTYRPGRCGRCDGCREIDLLFWVDRGRQIRRHVVTDSWESLLRAARFVDEVLFKLVQP